MWPCQVNVVDTATGGKLHSTVYHSPDIEFDRVSSRLTITDGPRREEFTRVQVHSIDHVGVTLSALVPPISGHGFAPDEVHISLSWVIE